MMKYVSTSKFRTCKDYLENRMKCGQTKLLVFFFSLVLASISCSSQLEEFNSVVFTPDGNYIVSGSNDGIARVWEAKTGILRYTLKGHTNEVSDVAVSPDGTIIATGSLDRTAIFWNANTGEEVYAFKPEPITRITPNNKKIVSDIVIHSIAFSPDGKWFAAATRPNVIHIWDVQTKELIKILETPTLPSDPTNGTTPYGVEFSADGKYISGFAWAGVTGPFMWRTDTFELTWFELNYDIQAIAPNPRDGSLAVSVDKGNNVIEILDLDNKRTVMEWEANTYQTASRALAYSHDGNLIALGDYDKIFTLWNANTGEAIPIEAQPPAFKADSSSTSSSIIPTSIAISPDITQVAVAGNYGVLGVWDAQTGTLLWQFDN